MKKYILIVLIVIIFIYIYIFTAHPSIGIIKNNITSETSNTSVITFNAKEGEYIKCVCDSNIKEGILELQITDSNEDIIKKIRINEENNLEILINKDGEYILSINYTDFVGSYKIEAYKH